MKKLIGALVLAVPFVGMFVLLSSRHSVAEIMSMFGIALVFSAFVFLGFYLMFDDTFGNTFGKVIRRAATKLRRRASG